MTTPQLYMIAGSNGAGKTTAAMTLLPRFFAVNQYVNADEIARGLSPLNPPSVALQAGRIMLKRLKTLMANRQDFAFETTASGKSHINTLKQARNAGYTCHLIFLYLSSVQIAKQRVASRVIQGGHDVPVKDIERRYYNGMSQFFHHYCPLADTVKIYDNTLGALTMIAEQKAGENWHIYNQPCWKRIQGMSND